MHTLIINTNYMDRILTFSTKVKFLNVLAFVYFTIRFKGKTQNHALYKACDTVFSFTCLKSPIHHINIYTYKHINYTPK